MSAQTRPPPPAATLVSSIQELGRRARAQVGTEDLKLAKRLKAATLIAELAGRLLLNFAPDFWTWLLGALTLGFHLAVEAQLNHSIMHGAFAGIPGAGRFTPSRYETLALPMQSRTWGDAHRIHHANPSLLERDPDTAHARSAFLDAPLAFEVWAWDYDAFLKKTGNRPAHDRGELKKFSAYLAYQFVFFGLLAGPRWKQVVLGTLAASVIRNLIFMGLQTSSSVGANVSTRHARDLGKKSTEAWYRFQVETSKNFGLHGIWTLLCGGLHRHIEHHLYPNLPPNRLDALSPDVRALCARHDIAYEEFPTFWRSLGDSLAYLRGLAATVKAASTCG